MKALLITALLFLASPAFADLTIDEDGNYNIDPIADTNHSIVVHTGGGSIQAISNDATLAVSCRYLYSAVGDPSGDLAQAPEIVKFKLNALGRCDKVDMDGDKSLPFKIDFNDIVEPYRVVTSLKEGFDSILTHSEYKASQFVKYSQYESGVPYTTTWFRCMVLKGSLMETQIKRLGFQEMIAGITYELKSRPDRSIPGGKRCSAGFARY